MTERIRNDEVLMTLRAAGNVRGLMFQLGAMATLQASKSATCLTERPAASLTRIAQSACEAPAVLQFVHAFLI